MNSRSLYFRSKSFLMLAILVMICGCSAKEFSINGPFTQDHLSAKQLIEKATRSCDQKPEDPAESIYPFTTDGCSVVPDGVWGDNAWRECCVLHDIQYWCGGSSEDRLQADRQLQQCIADKGYPFTGKIFYLGVRAGGHPIWPVPWRWGYGWEWYRAYEKAPFNE